MTLPDLSLEGHPSHLLHVPPAAAGTRLDAYLAQTLPDLSRSRAQQLIREGQVRVQGRAVKASHKVAPGEEITVTLPKPQPPSVEAERIPLEVVYEDADLLVINKPRGMVTHPAPGSPAGTLVNAVLAHCTDLSGIGGELRPGIVHRLDKDTSGLLVVAKHDTAHLHLARQIQARTAQRRYLALLYGDLRPDRREVDAPIGRHPTDRKRMAVTSLHSRPARTTFAVQERFGDFTLVEAHLHTGRTHQIRVHAAYIGHPVVGDPVYGQRLSRRQAPRHDPALQALLEDLHGQALHAHSLTFTHPRTSEALHFQVPPPEEMQRLLQYLRGRSPP